MGLKTKTIEELTEALIDYRGKTPRKTSSGVKLITAKVIKDGFVIDGNHEYIDEKEYDSWMQRGLPQQWDILITTEAPLGEVAQLRTPERVALAQRVILLRGNPKLIDQGYLFQALKSPFVQAGLKARSSGTTVLGIKQSELRKVEIPYRSLSSQQKIGSILSSYHDLIGNNTQRIRILEEMAQLIYREWFVHFRFPSHEKVRMVTSSFGKIPEGWAMKSLEELMEDHIGGGWGNDSVDTKHTEPAWVIRGTDIPGARYCQVTNVPHRYHAISNLSSRKLQAGDILFEVSGGSKDQPVGRALLITPQLLSVFGSAAVICASFCKRVRPNINKYDSELLYLSFLEGYKSGEIEQFQVQSTGISNFKWTEYIQKTKRVIPPDLIRMRFRTIVNPILSQIATLGLQSANLRRTRDLLLPKLISGELDVSELDIEVPAEAK